MSIPIKALLVNSYPLWSDACAKALAQYLRPVEVDSLTIQGEASALLEKPLADGYDIVLVALELPFVTLAAVRAIRALEFAGPVLVIGDQYDGFSVGNLSAVGAPEIVPLSASLDTLAQAIYRLVDQSPGEQVAIPPPAPPARPALNNREKEVLQLLASDLTDQEIATRLGISRRTVSNHLHHVYAKLGVKGRAGALGAALARGLIKLDYSYQRAGWPEG